MSIITHVWIFVQIKQVLIPDTYIYYTSNKYECYVLMDLPFERKTNLMLNDMSISIYKYMKIVIKTKLHVILISYKYIIYN